jgi:hypothetical protein
MKWSTIFLAPIVAVGMVSVGLARNYNDLVAEGYRWVAIDGPYACPTKEDLRKITGDPSDINELRMVEQVRACFPIQGALVKVIQEDGSTGMAQIHVAGITIDLWTHNKFLSRRPMKDAYFRIFNKDIDNRSRSFGSVVDCYGRVVNSNATPASHVSP